MAVPENGLGLERLRRETRDALVASWSGWPEGPCPLEPRTVGVLERDGYRVEKILIQTLPGVLMTANLYVPAGKGPFPAVLNVHGHWPGAKQDRVVQARCIGLAKLGFVALAVDALGAGERGVGTALGEYHGEMTAATLYPVGLPLSGLQVYENMRAVDYLQSRLEVDAGRIGITGASGGGNQSMYAGAFDERIGAVVPVCSVGTYEAYLGAACCLCEVAPGLLGSAEEWGVLSLVAPRGLMVVNASRDARQFSIAEALKSVGQASKVYGLMGRGDWIRQVPFDSGHDYSQGMREAMYGWMSFALKGMGDGGPVSEPTVVTEEPELLRCFPGDTRPKDWMTIPRLAAREGRRLLSEQARPQGVGEWDVWSKGGPEGLRRVLGLEGLAGGKTVVGDFRDERLEFEPEAGIRLFAEVKRGEAGKGVVILLDLNGAEDAKKHPVAEVVAGRCAGVVTLDLRATGALAWPNDRIGNAADHNTAEWGLWIGRPLLGQWVADVRGLLDGLGARGMLGGERVAVVGIGGAGLVAMAAAALDERVGAVGAIGTLGTYVTESPFVGQRLGVMVPGMLREVGDVTDLAAMVAPRRLVVAGGVTAQGAAMTLEELTRTHERGAMAWEARGARGAFQRLGGEDWAGVAAGLGL